MTLQVITAGVNGALKLWDVTARDGFPVASYAGHEGDVSSVDWNVTTKDAFATAGWDNSVCVSMHACVLRVVASVACLENSLLLCLV